MSRTDPPLRIRLPQNLKEQVQALAAENHRSMNAEIVARLERTVQEDGEAPKKGLKYLEAAKANVRPDYNKRLEDLENEVAAIKGKLGL